MSPAQETLLERVRLATAGEYVVEREIGRGGMAAVFLAHDVQLDRPVAIKVVLPHLADIADIAHRFVVEARTAARLDHPGIVTVYTVKQRDGLSFIVMKYIEGRTLDSVLRDSKTLEPAAAAAIVGQVAEALYFAHTEGVVHRDVKPSNVMIDMRGQPVITDFGIAKVLATESFTQTGSLLGTPTYISPEQCRGLPVTAASDQYSLGIMMYEMLAGRPPFTGQLPQLLRAHCEQPPPPIGLLVPGLDATIEATLLRMLEKDPRDRWPSLASVSRVLAPLGHAHGEAAGEPTVLAGARTMVAGAPTVPAAPQARSATAVPAGPRAVRHRTMRRLVLAGAIALFLLALAAVAIWISSRPAGPPPSAPTLAAPQAGAPPPQAAQPQVIVSEGTSTPPSAAADSSQSPKPAGTPPAVVAPKTVAPKATPVPPRSVPVECSRLLERVSLGETLTAAERDFLARNCGK